MDILLCQEQSPSVFRCLRQMTAITAYFNWKYRWYHLTNFGSTVNRRPWITNPFLVDLDLHSSDFKSNESKIQIWICQKEREIRFKIQNPFLD